MQFIELGRIHRGLGIAPSKKRVSIRVRHLRSEQRSRSVKASSFLRKPAQRNQHNIQTSTFTLKGECEGGLKSRLILILSLLTSESLSQTWNFDGFKRSDTDITIT